MENKSYSYGMKITGVLLHSFFTVITTVSIFLLVALIDKNILQLADIGTEEFLNSGTICCVSGAKMQRSERVYAVDTAGEISQFGGGEELSSL